MFRFAIAAAGVLMLCAPALAMAQGTAACKDGAIPFKASAANQLKAGQLQQAVTGKRLVYVRESVRTPGIFVNNSREFRADGSMVYVCRYSRSPNGPWQECKSYGSLKTRREGSRDVGIWSIRNDAVCSMHASFNEKAENCITLHREGAVLAAVRSSGSRTACIPGIVTLQ